ncbi:MAG: bacteriohemerythrin [Proteobacteria bacterium]|nr:bacteriohemerythrin [Pseudomonadota bacterium]
MNRIDIFPWDDNFCTGLPTVDEQHRKLVDLLNQLASRFARHSDELSLEQLFDELAAYTVYHFEHEEQIWGAFMGGTPQQIAHSNSHADFVRYVQEARRKLPGRPQQEVAEEILEFLTRWLASHILESDRSMAYTVLALQDGLSLEDAQARAAKRMSGATRTLIDLILSIYSTLSSNTLRLMRELTERRATEIALTEAKDALEKSGTLLQTIIDTVPMRVFWKDRELRYLGCNPVFAQDAGKANPAELLGRDDYAMAWAPEADIYRADDQAVISSGKAKLGYEEPQTTPDGRQIYLRSSKVPLHGHDGEIIGVLGVYEDITDLRNAVDGLRESEQKFHSLYTAMTEGVAIHQLVLDAAGQPQDYLILDVNPGFETILGLSQQDVIGRLASQVYGQVPFLDTYARVAGGGGPVRFESRFAPLDKVFTISVFSPAPGRFATVFQDITARTEAEAALRESEERLRLALGASNQGWFDLDLPSGRVNVSDNYASIIGYPTDGFESSLTNWLASIHPEDAPALQERFAACLRSGGPESMEYRRRTRDGAWVWIESVGKIVHWDTDGTPLRMIGIHTDISARKRASDEQQRLNRALRLLSECNLALVRDEAELPLLEHICRLVVESGGYVMAWVGYAEHDSGKTVTPVARSGYEEGYLDKVRISWDRDLDIGRGPTGTAIWSGQTQVNQDVQTNPALQPWRGAATQRGYHSSIALPLRTDDQAFGALTIYAAEAHAFGDDEIALLEELVANLSFGIRAQRTRAQREAAVAANRAKSSFIANMSHEIRTPLNAINGMVYLLRRDGVDARQAERLGKIEDASQHLLEIINAVLDLSKIEADKLELADQPIDLHTLLHSAAAMVQERAHAKQLQLSVSLSPDPAPALRGDATRLQQALLNYLANAVKFTDAGSIHVSCRVVDDSPDAALVRFEVRDSGIGIAADVLARLFSAFEQADNSTTRQYGGTGLGLAITRKLAGLMGGEAGADSVPGQGSTFWFTARLKHDRQAVAAIDTPTDEDAAEQLRQHYGQRRVLLVEDEPTNQEVARLFLEEADLVVDVANDGLEAVERASASPYDLILMDMQMPRLDGLDATRQIRRLAQHRLTPIVAMTANAFAEDRARCLEAGMNDFIPKPVAPALLFATLLRSLRAARS